MNRLYWLTTIAVALFQSSWISAENPKGLCKLLIVDRENGWPVPLVELRTTHNVRFISDNAGQIAFDLPELVGMDTWFTVEGDGYSVDPDGFGFRGIRVRPEPGKEIKIELNRTLPAKRLGRLTGAGIFGESQRLGDHLDWKESGVFGCDSIQMAIYKNRLIWNWGDTLLPSYPLGLFQMTGASTRLDPLKDARPPIKISFEYYRDERGKLRSIAEVPGEGPTWLGGYAVVKDSEKREHLIASYEKITPPLTVKEIGFCEWDDEKQTFKPIATFWKRTKESDQPPQFPTGHPIPWTDPSGLQWLLFGHGIPDLKVPATMEAILDSRQWTKLDPQKTIESTSGRSIEVHRGSIAWNPYLQKWLFVFTQLKGTASTLGEIWMAISETPFGPFRDAVQVATHDHYTFYNPLLHPELSDPKSAVILFEGTYTNMFSATAKPKPRVDYNQVLYRVDLDEPPFNHWK